MTEEEIEKKIKDLIEEISHHTYLYYGESNPSISDSEFDLLLEELRGLEKTYPQFKFSYSPTQTVGGSPDNNQFKTVTHGSPVLSLSKANNLEELNKFLGKCHKSVSNPCQVSIQPKCDGVSISIVYKKGIIFKAISRGNGREGDDITPNAKTIKNLPKKLNGEYNFTVRGEVVMTNSVFLSLNEERRKSGDKLFANSRNAASGTLRQKNPAETAKRHLTFIAFDIVDYVDSEVNFISYTDKIELLKSLRFQVLEHKLVNSDEPLLLEQLILEQEANQEKLNFDTDGCVIKLTSLANQKILGCGTNYPNWAIAFKFKNELNHTTLLGVDFQVGSTGKVTPVAILEPINIGKTIVERCTLNNMRYINTVLPRLEYGDEVCIEKANLIIPKITGKYKSCGSGDEVVMPEFCSCGSKGKFKLNPEGTMHFCSSGACPLKSSGVLSNAVGKDGFHIGGLGPKTINKLMEFGLVINLDDIFDIPNKKEAFIAIPGFGTKGFENLCSEIEKSIKFTPYNKVLRALPIPDIGNTNSKLIAEKFSDITLLINATAGELKEIDGIGEKTSANIHNWFLDRDNLELISRLISKNINFELEVAKVTDVASEVAELTKANGLLSELSGKNILVTGKFEGKGRVELTMLLESIGAIIMSSVTNKLHLMITGDAPGPAKMSKAKKLGIDVMSQEAFKTKYEI